MSFLVISIIHFSCPQFLLIIWSIDKTHQEQINNQTKPNGKTICQHKLKIETASSNGDKMNDFFSLLLLLLISIPTQMRRKTTDKMIKIGHKMAHFFGWFTHVATKNYEKNRKFKVKKTEHHAAPLEFEIISTWISAK